MAPGHSVPPGLASPPQWDASSDRLEDLLAQVGFDSSDLGEITQPTLAMTGALSNPRFARLAERLVEVLPHTQSTTFSSCSHLTPPHRIAPDQLEDELERLWRRS